MRSGERDRGREEVKGGPYNYARAQGRFRGIFPLCWPFARTWSWAFSFSFPARVILLSSLSCRASSGFFVVGFTASAVARAVWGQAEDRVAELDC